MIKLILLFLLIQSNCWAAQIVYPTTYSPNSQVTNVTLNGNNSAISNVVNGGLDNTNANTTAGYRFYQTVSVLPSAGSQGAVYFLTSDNSLNFDNGSSFTKSISVSSPVQGDVVYYNGSGWSNLAPGTAGQSLITNGTSQNPSYQTVTPIGGIILWSGSIVSIPSNWHLCDGTTGTPNLENLFVIGAGGTYAVGATGGSTTISQGNLPSYNLTFTRYDGNGSSLTGVQGTTNGASASTQSVSSGGSGTTYLQPYYSLAYIMRVS